MNKTMITIFQRYRITEFGHQNRNITNEQLINIINLIEQKITTPNHSYQYSY